VGYVQRSGYVETIRTSQQPNDSSRKSDSGTTETASQTHLRSKREAAESRASPSPRGKLRKAEQVRVQEGSCGKQSKSESKREAAESKSKPESKEEAVADGALKLVTPFKGEKKDVLAFIANVDTAFEVIDPRNESTLFKFVLTRISGEPRTAIAHRNLENWEELKEFLKNT